MERSHVGSENDGSILEKRERKKRSSVIINLYVREGMYEVEFCSLETIRFKNGKP